MHVADRALGILGTNGIVGAGLPIATGAALACQLSGQGNVAVAFFGEGATGEGAFHESLNLAQVWGLPAVFVCENNGFAEMMSAAHHMPSPDVADRAVGYNMPVLIADGNDVEAVMAASAEAISRARANGGPTLVEAKTFRWRGHYEGDPQRYRVDGELDEWRGRDPIELQRRRLEEAGILDPTSWDSLCQIVGTELDDAIEFARQSPWPEPAAVTAHTYRTSVSPGITDRGTSG
jgi:pyruvate dehydrogenase E1 component alpha subunit